VTAPARDLGRSKWGTDWNDADSVVSHLTAYFPHRVAVRAEHLKATEVWCDEHFGPAAVAEQGGHHYWTSGSWCWISSAHRFTFVFTDPNEALACRIRWA
jgi:hypothetical protein